MFKLRRAAAPGIPGLPLELVPEGKAVPVAGVEVVVLAVERLDDLHVLLLQLPRAHVQVLCQLVFPEAEGARVDAALHRPLQCHLLGRGACV